MSFTAWFMVGCFVGFCVVLVVLTIKGAREDAEEERVRVHKMLTEMPHATADRWLRKHRKGPRCACTLYNLRYTDTVKTNGGDHQIDRCQPARERIEIDKSEGWA